MVEYGFEEGKDFEILVGQKCPTNNPKNPWTEITDHVLSLDMAKHLAMIQRTEKGKRIRQYFIEVERKFQSGNSPAIAKKDDYVARKEKTITQFWVMGTDLEKLHRKPTTFSIRSQFV